MVKLGAFFADLRLNQNRFLRSTPTPGDGNCMAHAILDQLSYDPVLRYMAATTNHRSIRELVVNSLPQMLSDGRMSEDFFNGDLIGT